MVSAPDKRNLALSPHEPVTSVAEGDDAAVATSVEPESPDATALTTIIAPIETPEPTSTTGNSTEFAAPTMTAVANATLSNSTEGAILTSAAATAPTATDIPLNATNDPNECHVEGTDSPEFMGNPFCKPYAGQIALAGKQVEVTWDTALFSANSTTSIEIEYFNDTPDKTDTEEPLEGYKAPNSDGAMIINMTSSWLKGEPSANLTLFLISDDGGIILTGPTILLTKDNSTSGSSSSGSKKKLGEEVGIPTGLVVIGVALVIIGAFVCLRRRASGYSGTGKARNSGVPAGAAAATAGSRGHRRDLSFHDEPTRGVELQDRNKGYGPDDTWDWGSPVNSPPAGARGNNVFRDELGRQKAGRGY